MVWANGNQNLGAVNFLPESRLPFAQISSIYRKTAPRKPEKLALSGFEGMEHEFSCRTLLPEKQDYLLRCSIALGNFPLKRPKKSCSFYFSTGLSGNPFGNGKQFLSFLNEDMIIFIVCFIQNP